MSFTLEWFKGKTMSGHHTLMFCYVTVPLQRIKPSPTHNRSYDAHCWFVNFLFCVYGHCAKGRGWRGMEYFDYLQGQDTPSWQSAVVDVWQRLSLNPVCGPEQLSFPTCIFVAVWTGIEYGSEIDHSNWLFTASNKCLRAEMEVMVQEVPLTLSPCSPWFHPFNAASP